MDAVVVSAPIHGSRTILSLSRPSLKPFFHLPQILRFPTSKHSRVPVVKASSSGSDAPAPISAFVRTAVSGALFVSALVSVNFHAPPARADPAVPAAPPATEETAKAESDSSVLSRLLESNPEAVDALRTVLYQKLEVGEDSEALAVLRRLIAAQPTVAEWKFLAARLLNEMGEPAEALRLYEEILADDPLCFEALFENAVLMDQFGEGDAAIERLERALELARDEQKEKEARDVRLIMAQIQFLQKKVDEALANYEELATEDPKDYRPYFCKGVIYSLSDRNKEAREMFAKYHELTPKKFEVDGYLQTSLSRVKQFSTEDS